MFIPQPQNMHLPLMTVKKNSCDSFFSLRSIVRYVHHWGWCQHIWAVWGEDSLLLGVCYSQPVLYFSHNPSCIGPGNQKDEEEYEWQGVKRVVGCLFTQLLKWPWGAHSWQHPTDDDACLYCVCERVGGWKASSHTQTSCYNGEVSAHTLSLRN